ncbi:39S ribosomal protein L55, mitochondrial-like [Mya arenaria]|uniref:39S ribosomal protein L55, mitochondrial-like n=1 Tax=Mya arenaria TaxID=6604 RepID=UPI0022DEFF11|nr:39S ribosomal protein L55, mitochondrial-like [Mya arenaria]
MAASIRISSVSSPLTCLVRPLFVTKISSNSNLTCYRQNCHMAAITKTQRKHFMRTYPVLLVQPDGSTINIQYKIPRAILKLPENLDRLTEAEKQARRKKLNPVKVIEIKEDIEDEIDLANEYQNLLDN